MRVCWDANTSPPSAGDGRQWFGRSSQAACSATFSGWEISPATRDQSRRRFTARGRFSSQAVSCFDWLPANNSREHHRVMSVSARVTILSLGIAGLACSPPPRPSAGEATAGIDSLNARLVQAYRSHDPRAYAALYTDTAVFQWPAFNPVRGRAEPAAVARRNWAALQDMDLRLIVSTRRLTPDHAHEFGAFQQSRGDP